MFESDRNTGSYLPHYSLQVFFRWLFAKDPYRTHPAPDVHANRIRNHRAFAGHHAPQVEYVLRHSRPRFVIVSGTHQLKKIDAEQHTTVQSYYCVDFDADAERWGAIPFESLTETGKASAETLNARLNAVKSASSTLW